MDRQPSSFTNTRRIIPAVLGALASIFLVAALAWAATTINNNITTGTVTSGTLSSSGDLYASSTVQSTLSGLFYASVGVGGTTSPTTTFSVIGSGYFSGGVGVGFATTTAGQFHVSGMSMLEGDVLSAGRFITTNTGTSSFTGGASFGGISTTNGLTISSGVLNASGVGARVGTLGVGTTSPYQEFGTTGDGAFGSSATTTVSLESTSATRGGCIELKDGVGARWVRIYIGGHAATTSNATVIVSGGKGLLVIEEGRCQ